MRMRMNHMLLLSAMLLVGSVQAADSSSSSSSKTANDHDCLFARRPQSWQVLDDQTLVLWGSLSNKDAYLVKIFTPVPDLSFAMTLAVIDGDHDGRICGGSMDRIEIPDSKMSLPRMTISSMRKVDEAELKALGEQYKVNLLSGKKSDTKPHDKQPHLE